MSRPRIPEFPDYAICAFIKSVERHSASNSTLSSLWQQNSLYSCDWKLDLWRSLMTPIMHYNDWSVDATIQWRKVAVLTTQPIRVNARISKQP
jgi:hypothetical protein